MLRLLQLLCLFIISMPGFSQHPVTFFTKEGAAKVKQNLSRYPLLTQSYQEIKTATDLWIGKPLEVPFPKDPAGGYTHDRHKANYTLMFNSGVLYNITGEPKYAKLVKDLLLEYAKLNPTLKNHPEATSTSPGRIFWQALNDANWLVYAGMAYDLVHNSIPAAERKQIEEGAFKPEVDFFTKELPQWFNLIHNHAVWAVAGVGIVGIASGNKDYVDMALYGTKKDGKSGFLALMDGLFSPDGYYTEGPYYVRYAILPYYLFANAINHAQPALKIFEKRDRILQKALHAGLQLTNTGGTFFALNDAIKEKDYTSNELVTAISIATEVYGKDNGLLLVAKKQDRVLLNPGGVAIASAFNSPAAVPTNYPYKTVEYTDGANGKEGGVAVLRNGKGNNLTSLLYKYTSHGLSHGHFDKLNYNLYDQGNEILSDYGAVRFVGVEQKYGGRYLPETKGYAAQTIAHNTIVVDEISHFEGKESVAENFHSQKLFSKLGNPAALMVGAKEENAYKDVKLQRTLYLLELPAGRKIMADIFRVASPGEHQYDLPFHYNGQLMSTSFKYKTYHDKQETLGKKNGYQYLWKEAEAEVSDTVLQMSFLNNKTYYTISSLVKGNAQVFFARTGANDPNFNLRHEPSLVLRKKGKEELFVNVLEIHGNYDPISEFSTNAYPSVSGIRVIQNDQDIIVAEIMVDGKKLIITQHNTNADHKAAHSAAGYKWTGPAAVFYAGKQLN